MFRGDNLEYKSSIHQDSMSTIDYCKHYCCSRANGIDLCPCHILIHLVLLKCIIWKCMHRKRKEEKETIKQTHQCLDWQGQTNSAASLGIVCTGLCLLNQYEATLFKRCTTSYNICISQVFSCTAGTKKPRKIVTSDVLESIYYFNKDTKQQNSTDLLFYLDRRECYVKYMLCRCRNLAQTEMCILYDFAGMHFCPFCPS